MPRKKAFVGQKTENIGIKLPKDEYAVKMLQLQYLSNSATKSEAVATAINISIKVLADIQENERPAFINGIR